MKLKQLLTEIQRAYDIHGDIETYLETENDEHNINHTIVHHAHGDTAKPKYFCISTKEEE